MTSDDIPEDASLLRCTLKKSRQVLAKVILYASYAIVGFAVAAISLYGLIGIWGIVSPILAAIVAKLVSVPWYYYAGAVALAAIPVYSFLWCMARELTEEDWKSAAANNSVHALVLALVLALVHALVLALVLALAHTAAIALAPAIALALVLVLACDPDDTTTVWYYIFRFPGAVWHHHKKNNGA